MNEETNGALKSLKLLTGRMKNINGVDVETQTSGLGFISPHYIEELGCDGLTAEEIALSLNTRVNEVRRKLREQPNETLKSLKLEITTLKNINGVEYEEFCLSTAAAKFFVARYESTMGDGYLAYLITLDMAAERYLRDRLKDNERAQLELTKRTLALEASLTAREKEDEEPITNEEYDLLDRTANLTLRRQGRFREAYKRGFKREILSRFYLPGEMEGTYTYLPRKNFKAAILYARNREFDWTTMREFLG